MWWCCLVCCIRRSSSEEWERARASKIAVAMTNREMEIVDEGKTMDNYRNEIPAFRGCTKMVENSSHLIGGGDDSRRENDSYFSSSSYLSSSFFRECDEFFIDLYLARRFVFALFNASWVVQTHFTKEPTNFLPLRTGFHPKPHQKWGHEKYEWTNVVFYASVARFRW